MLFPSVRSSQTQTWHTTWKEVVIRPVDQGTRSIADEHSDCKDVQLSGGLASLSVTSTNCQESTISSIPQVNPFKNGYASQDHQSSTLTTFFRKEKKENVACASETNTKQASKGSYNVCQQATSNPKAQKASLATDTTCIRISSLCLALKDADCRGKVEECLGHLTDQDRQLGVYLIGQHSLTTGPETMTLQDILSQGMSLYLGHAPRIPLSTLKFRLELAATLSSTALQLQTTPWLDSS